MSTEKIGFYSNKEKYYEFSNYYLTPIIYNKKTYASSEHLYQAMKFMYEGASSASLEYAEVIRRAKTPNMSRILAGQKIGGGYAWRTALNAPIKEYLEKGAKIDPNWEKNKDSVMRQVLLAKFTQNKKLKELLVSTGDTELYEDSPSDMYWGVKGKNRLGELLMEIREELK